MSLDIHSAFRKIESQIIFFLSKEKNILLGKSRTQLQHIHLFVYYSPCPMCTGTAMLYKIPRIVVGENVNYKSPAEKWLEEAKVQVHLEQNKECIQMMETFIKTKPELWNEDIHDI